MKNPKIVVLCGGISPEREVSLASGKNVFEALSKFYETEKIILEENRIPENLDSEKYIVFPAMHGDYGENGLLQEELSERGFSYAGSESLSSKVCMIKPATKALMKTVGIPVAKEFLFEASNNINAESLCKILGNKLIIKPADKGSSVGLQVASNVEECEKALSLIDDGHWMAEEFFEGRELSVGVLYGKAAGIVEIIPEGGVYDFKRKYTPNSTRYEFPAKIEESIANKIKFCAEKAFEVCQCRDFARIDFILKNSKFISLEINTLPGMTPTSLLPKSASCIGYDYDNLCKKMISGAISRFETK